MKKVTRIIMIIIVLLGIGFSILNFMSPELNASPMRGAWVEDDCMGDGNDCSIGFENH